MCVCMRVCVCACVPLGAKVSLESVIVLFPGLIHL